MTKTKTTRTTTTDDHDLGSADDARRACCMTCKTTSGEFDTTTQRDTVHEHFEIHKRDAFYRPLFRSLNTVYVTFTGLFAAKSLASRFAAPRALSLASKSLTHGHGPRVARSRVK